jgi:hypothetical protein
MPQRKIQGVDLTPASNVVLWSGISPAAADALKLLLEAGECHFRPTSALTYLCDGMMLKLPLVKRSRHYKTPHWCPCVLKPGRPTSRHQNAVTWSVR